MNKQPSRVRPSHLHLVTADEDALGRAGSTPCSIAAPEPMFRMLLPDADKTTMDVRITLQYPNGRTHEATVERDAPLEIGDEFQMHGRHWQAVARTGPPWKVATRQGCTDSLPIELANRAAGQKAAAVNRPGGRVGRPIRRTAGRAGCSVCPGVSCPRRRLYRPVDSVHESRLVTRCCHNVATAEPRRSPMKIPLPIRDG